MNRLIDVNNVSVIRNKHNILDNLSFQSRNQSLHIILGPNGAGKTTLLKVLCGLMHFNEGSVSVLEKNPWKDHGELMKQIGAIIEAPSYYEDFTAAEYLNFLGKVHKGNVNTPMVMAFMEEFGLNLTDKKKIRNFSVGMKMKLAICSCVLHNPKLLILDEPTTGLDPAGVLTLKRWLLKLKETYGVSILLSSHALTEFDEIFDELSFVVEGKVLLTFSREESSHFYATNVKTIGEQMKNLEAQGYKLLYSRSDVTILSTKEDVDLPDIHVRDFGLKKINLEELYFLITREVT